MKFLVELEKRVDFVIEAPTLEAAMTAAKQSLSEDWPWWNATDDYIVNEYTGPTEADFAVDAEGKEVEG